MKLFCWPNDPLNAAIVDYRSLRQPSTTAFAENICGRRTITVAVVTAQTMKAGQQTQAMAAATSPMNDARAGHGLEVVLLEGEIANENLLEVEESSKSPGRSRAIGTKPRLDQMVDHRAPILRPLDAPALKDDKRHLTKLLERELADAFRATPARKRAWCIPSAVGSSLRSGLRSGLLGERQGMAKEFVRFERIPRIRRRDR